METIRQNVRKNMKTALLISTYNWVEALDVILASVKKQSLMPNEILIADDGSGEATKRLIDEYKKTIPIPIKHIWHEDKGFRKSIILNKTIASSDSDYIIQIDGDCIINKYFVEDHIKNVIPKTYLYGSRVNTREKYLKRILGKKITSFHLFSKEIKNNGRTIRINQLARLYSSQDTISHKIRGCNLSFWRNDFIDINGYNEDFEGWGVEDSEMAIRLHNNRVRCKRLKFNGIMYHLYHKTESRENFEKNRLLEKLTKDQFLIRCNNGINKYL
ncbi:MAG: hypothetical protein RL662_259 [Bacteroidota bacterium]|jgi:glycosyltransferase involved in cell wall biosynthesis